MNENKEIIVFDRTEDFFSLCNLFYEWYVVILHCIVAAIFSPFALVKIIFMESWKIFTTIWSDMAMAMSFCINALHIWYLTFSTTRIFMIGARTPEEEYKKIMSYYEEMKEVTDYFHFTPMRKEQAIILHLLFGKIPDIYWDNILPYPNVFFDGSITNAYAGTGKIYASEEKRKGPFKKQPSMIRFKDIEENKMIDAAVEARFRESSSSQK